MNSIRYLLFGIGVLLFAICMYIFGITVDSRPAMFVGLFSQVTGMLFLLTGFFKKDTDKK